MGKTNKKDIVEKKSKKGESDAHKRRREDQHKLKDVIENMSDDNAFDLDYYEENFERIHRR